MDVRVFVETERLWLREIREEDAACMMQLDADEAVLRFLQEKPVVHIEEALWKINYIRQQYRDNNTGRWAVIRKEDEAFLGWCGIKLVNDRTTNGRTGYYDIGYRLLPQYWKQGYSYEAAAACCNYAFKVLKVTALHATVMQGNIASARIAEKLGMQLLEHFTEEGRLWTWYTLLQEEFLNAAGNANP